MKTVFSNHMVAHVFATQSQEEGRSQNGNFYFSGRALFSYGRHFIVAYAIPRISGGFLFLINPDSYSISTSRHQAMARAAIPGRAYIAPNLTRLADDLNAALDAWEYHEMPGGRTRPVKVAATMARRREYLPRIKRAIAANWPGQETAAAILGEFGQRNAARAAAAMARRHAATVAAEAAAKAKRKREDVARNAKYLATFTPARIRAEISDNLNRYSGQWGRDKVKEMSRHLFAAIKEARARGWTRIAATLSSHRAMVRAALADIDNREAMARRQGAKREAIARFREDAANVARLMTPRDAGGIAGEGSPETRARWYRDLADSCHSLLRHWTPPAATVARLRSIHDAARIRMTEENENAARARFEAEAERRRAWLAGETGLGYGRLSDQDGGALLRAVDVARDESGAIVSGVLETGHGAQVPLVHALRVFAFLRHCRATGRAWKRNGASLRVGHFHVDSVTPQGDFVAGCHRINWQEVARLAESLGVAELAPADTTEGHAIA
ncbi:hypothetical protein [Synechococcus virus S-ESS1]|uniref:Uncharacterized protein n=1 Tax=Synechococcus virus S-ESS1 TaxID=1964565 RepID=A0A1V0DX52_9CAUD|nr:hypothetical protein JT310_gp52 [Synechococcus virus S-ESS1]ARB05742.1 hypothetical protein [Synechococcus virus S-ESS1]